jgi:hypothetical protein
MTGNKAKAARICGLERKTTYGWKRTREIRLKTRKKILTALIENLTEETLDFIVQRSAESSADVLRIFLSALYEKAMDEHIATPEFVRLASKFDQIRQKYSGLVVENLASEVGNMLGYFMERVDELGISFRFSPINMVKLTEFSLLIPNLIKTISVVSPYTPDNEIAKVFNIPKEFIDTFSEALRDNYIAIRVPVQPMRAEPTDHVDQISATGTLQQMEKSVWVEQQVPGIKLAILGGTK